MEKVQHESAGQQEMQRNDDANQNDAALGGMLLEMRIERQNEDGARETSPGQDQNPLERVDLNEPKQGNWDVDY